MPRRSIRITNDDFISEGGKIWDRAKAVGEANNCVPHMLQVLTAARKAGLRVLYALHYRYRPGGCETWRYIAPIQKAAWSRKTVERGTWGGEIRREFGPPPGDILAWGSGVPVALLTLISICSLKSTPFIGLLSSDSWHIPCGVNGALCR